MRDFMAALIVGGLIAAGCGGDNPVTEPVTGDINTETDTPAEDIPGSVDQPANDPVADTEPETVTFDAEALDEAGLMVAAILGSMTDPEEIGIMGAYVAMAIYGAIGDIHAMDVKHPMIASLNKQQTVALAGRLTEISEYPQICEILEATMIRADVTDDEFPEVASDPVEYMNRCADGYGRLLRSSAEFDNESSQADLDFLGGLLVMAFALCDNDFCLFDEDGNVEPELDSYEAMFDAPLNEAYGQPQNGDPDDWGHEPESAQEEHAVLAAGTWNWAHLEAHVADEQFSDDYDLAAFGDWQTIPATGCRLDDAILAAFSRTITILGDDNCTPVSGTWISMYQQDTYTNPEELAIIHVVSPREAWESGAHAWTDQQRNDWFNDVAALVVVSADEAQQVTETFDGALLQPANNSCSFLEAYVNSKLRWELTVEQTEYDLIAEAITGCPAEIMDGQPTFNDNEEIAAVREATQPEEG